MGTGWVLPDSDRLQSLADIQDEIEHASLELLDVMGVLARRAQLLTDSAGSTIELLEAEELVCCTATGIAKPMLGARRASSVGLSGATLSADEILRSNQLMTDPLSEGDWAREVEALSAMCAPLELNGALVGVVKVVSPDEDAFSEEDAGTLRAVSRFISDAMFQTILPELQGDTGSIDPVTHLGGRGLYEQRLSIEADRSNRYGRPLTVMLIRLDGYYDSGLLKEVANLVRGVDECFLIDAGEFAIIMPDTDRAGAEIAANRVKNTIRERYGKGKLKAETSVAEAAGPDGNALHTAAAAALALSRLK
jgi:GGDEF domain-containing protein/putative methionine-R-sulfoxide reductase with GAF domain